MAQLWNWIFQRNVTRTCLGADPNAALEIQFPTLVRQAQIKFCGDFGAPEFSPLRTPRSLDEVGEVIQKAHEKAPTGPISKPARLRSLSTPQRKAVIPGLYRPMKAFNVYISLGRPQDANDPKSRKGFSIQEICYLGVAEAERAALIAKETRTNEAMRLLPPSDAPSPAVTIAWRWRPKLWGRSISTALICLRGGWGRRWKRLTADRGPLGFRHNSRKSNKNMAGVAAVQAGCLLPNRWSTCQAGALRQVELA